MEGLREPHASPGRWVPSPLRVAALALVASTAAGWAAHGERGEGLTLSLARLLEEGRVWTLLTYPFAPAPLAAQVMGLAGVLSFGSLLAEARGAHRTVRCAVSTVLAVGLCALFTRGAPFAGWLGIGLSLATTAIFPLRGGQHPRGRRWAAGYVLAGVGAACLEGGALPAHLVGIPVGIALAVAPPCARDTARRWRAWRLEREIRADLLARERIDALLTRIDAAGGWDRLPRRDRRALRLAAKRVAVSAPREPARSLPADGAGPSLRGQAASPPLQHRVDELLAKIHRSGTGSLTQDERKDLHEASEWYRRRT
ncbi:MAG: hypothetical protein HY608_04145 [Planctomycetes bacterium]|nr:hypothetical protein [Planctomycetota bacterium]